MAMLFIIVGFFMMFLPLHAKADPLTDCRNIASQMQANAANDGISAAAVTLSYKAALDDLERKLAAVTRERDELRNAQPRQEAPK